MRSSIEIADDLRDLVKTYAPKNFVDPPAVHRFSERTRQMYGSAAAALMREYEELFAEAANSLTAHGRAHQDELTELLRYVRNELGDNAMLALNVTGDKTYVGIAYETVGNGEYKDRRAVPTGVNDDTLGIQVRFALARLIRKALLSSPKDLPKDKHYED